MTKFDPAKFQRGADLRSTLARFGDGSQTITVDDGVKLTAQKSNGQFSTYQAVDSHGAALETFMANDGDICMICIRRGTTTICHDVPCPPDMK